jgi:homotetrameric cytidine deaminase
MIWQTLEKRVYNPYSDITQTVALLGESGRLYPGVRIENISFPLSIDAVAVAFTSCLSEGDRPAKLFAPEEPDRLAWSWCDEFSIPATTEPPPVVELFNPLILTGVAGIFKLLQETASQAYVPNSGFRVASLIETEKGLVAGVNVETKAWVNGLCAERVALAKAIAAGIRSFKAIHIYAPKADFISPCGACRQVLIEHLSHHPVKLYYNDGTISEYFSDHLLPYHFNSAWLKAKKR